MTDDAREWLKANYLVRGYGGGEEIRELDGTE